MTPHVAPGPGAYAGSRAPRPRPALLGPAMFVGDVVAGHGRTAFVAAAEAAGCRTAGGGAMVEAAQDVMADFLLQR